MENMTNYPKNNIQKDMLRIQKVDNKTIASSSKRIHKLTTRQKQEDFLVAYVDNVGLRYKSCRIAGIRYSTFRRWLQDPDFKIKLNEAQEQVNELVEQSLINKFRTNSPVPEIFYLRSRDPRYSQRITMEGDADKPIVVTHSEETLRVVSKAIAEILNKN